MSARVVPIVFILAATLAGCAAPGGGALPVAAAPAGPHDGDWLTTLSCEPARGALGYSYRFVSTVSGGQLHGAYGTPERGGSLTLSGAIAADGSASLYADGRTGAAEFVPGRDTPRGSPYGYRVQARFGATSGTGTRVDGRPCSLTFARQ